MSARKSGAPKNGSPFAFNLLTATSTKALAEGLEQLHEALTNVGQVRRVTPLGFSRASARVPHAHAR
jgi:hypothetical protein